MERKAMRIARLNRTLIAAGLALLVAAGALGAWLYPRSRPAIATQQLAQAAIDEALQVGPDNVEALIGAGTLANARHQFQEALQLGERARAANPSVPRVYGVIADAQTELGMYDDAIATLQTMVDMRPDLSSYSRVSYARELHGDLDGAIEAMRMAVDAGGPTLSLIHI